MDIDEKTVEYVAKLARLSVSDEESAKFLPQLNKIIKYVEKLNELDTEDVEPTYSVIPMKNVFREDENKTSLSQSEAVSNAPTSQDGFFKVPKII